MRETDAREVSGRHPLAKNHMCCEYALRYENEKGEKIRSRVTLVMTVRKPYFPYLVVRVWS